MNIISVRVNDEEMTVLENASKLYSDGKISSMIKKIVFEKLDEDFDLKTVQEYLKKKNSGSLKTRKVEDVCADLGIDWDSL